MRRWFAAGLLLAAVVSAEDKIVFEKDIQPIFEAKCYGCHGPDKQLSGLRLDKRQNALRGGDYGKVIIPGNSAASKLVDRLTGSKAGMQMPPEGPLEPHEIDRLRAWIDQGPDYGNSQGAVTAASSRRTAPALEAVLHQITANDLRGLGASIDRDRSLATATDANGSTALMHAAGKGSLDSMRVLLKAGAPVNAKNRRGATALIWALGDPMKVKLLLDAGADVRVRTGEAKTPLHIAALQPAIPETIRLLLAKGADPNAADLAGLTPLHAAAGIGSEGNLRLLLEGGAKVNAESASGMTALIQAATNGANHCVKLLLERGADPKIMTKRKINALGQASYWGDVETMRALIAKGAPVQIHDADGYSPLMFAAYSETAPAAAVELLMKHGARPQPGTDDESPALLARRRGAPEIAQLLEQNANR